jgi:hypothetical protein
MNFEKKINADTEPIKFSMARKEFALLLCLEQWVSMVRVIYMRIKDELPVTFVSLKIIVYLAILGVNLPSRLDFWGGGPPIGTLHV